MTRTSKSKSAKQMNKASYISYGETNKFIEILKQHKCTVYEAVKRYNKSYYGKLHGGARMHGSDNNNILTVQLSATQLNFNYDGSFDKPKLKPKQIKVQ